MSDQPEQHDEATLPEDAVEDLSPEAEGEDVSGGSLNYLKLTPSSNSLKIESPGVNITGDGSV
jgi:hypothetical protein